MATRKKTKADKQAQFERIYNRLNAGDVVRVEKGAMRTKWGVPSDRRYASNRYGEQLQAALERRGEDHRRAASITDYERGRLSRMVVGIARRQGLNINLNKKAEAPLDMANNPRYSYVASKAGSIK